MLAGRIELDRRDPNYVPTECLLYFVRHCREEMRADVYDSVYEALLRRVMSSPSSKHLPSETTVSEAIRERTFERFVDLLATDAKQYSNKLDYFEVRFDHAMSGLKVSVQRVALPEDARRLSPSVDDANVSADVIEGVRDDSITIEEDLESEDFRNRFYQAVDKLSPDQRRTVHMLLHGFPIDSSDPNLTTISGALKKTPRMINNYKNAAFEHLRRELAEEGV